MRANPETRHWTLTPERTLWITGCLALVVVPHAARIPAWVLVSFAALAGWRVANAMRGVPLPSKWLVIVLSATMLTAVYASYGTLFGRDAGVALLAALAGMKLMESRRLRDAYVLSALGYFPLVSLVMGLPGETEADIEQSMRWVNALGDLRATVFPVFHAPLQMNQARFGPVERIVLPRKRGQHHSSPSKYCSQPCSATCSCWGWPIQV